MGDETHLSGIETMWSMVHRSQDATDGNAQSAQQQLLDQYGPAIKKYLVACLKNQEAAEDVFQDFALKMIRGDFHRADAAKGRFRSFLKTTLYRLVVDYSRKRNRNAASELPHDDALPKPTSAEMPEFDEVWRNALFSKTMDELRELQNSSGKPFYSVMRLKVAHPHMKTPELAAKLSEEMEKEISNSNLRVILHRAREKFAELLVQQVAETLDNPKDLEQELATMNLLDYCRSAL